MMPITVQRLVGVVAIAGTVVLAGCATEIPVTQPESNVATSAAAPIAEGATRYTVASGSEARYRVREQLAGNALPNDAVGETDDVSGVVVLNPNGTIAEGSVITVDLTGLTSDQSMRDSFIKQNTLQTSRYPNAQFTITGISGLPALIPTSGSYDVQLAGNLMIHGVTRPATWTGTIAFSGSSLSGNAKTSVRLVDFGMTPPSVARVLSIDEQITLEIDFTATR